MAYNKTIWKDRVVEKPRNYRITNNEDGTVTLTPVPGTVTEQGTPITAENMNNIENGIFEFSEKLINFLSNGGEIGGRVSSEVFLTLLSNSQQWGMHNRGGHLAFPRYNSDGDFVDVPFEIQPNGDFYLLNGYSKNTNGYSKLPNGLIIQWGVFTSNGINVNAEIAPTITLPINFPNRIGIVLPVVRKCVNESGATVNAEVIIKQVTIYTAGTYAVRLKAKEYVPGGVEVGYIAIGW